MFPGRSMMRHPVAMHDQPSYPSGAHLDQHWVETGGRDLGLIAVPDRSEPVVVEWVCYACPEREHGPEYKVVFWHGARRLQVRERYHEVVTRDSVRYCRRLRHTSATGVCATELVLVLAAGSQIALERIEQGAYRGLWCGQVHAGLRRRRDQVESLTCRVVLDLDRGHVLLFRRRALTPRTEGLLPGR
jgi:hypothetical protein